MEYLKTITPYQKVKKLGNGLRIIKDAYNVHVRSEINGIQSLEFDIPNNSTDIQLINNEVWFDIGGAWFFPIESAADNNTHVTHYNCRHITALMSINNMIPDFPIMVAVNPYEILTEGLKLCGNDYWELIPPDELPEGIEWVDSLTDIVDGLEKISLWELINKTIELIGFGELYFDNYRFAIVKRIGRDTSKVWSPQNNIEKIKKSINYAEISNALLVLGQNDMPLDIEKYPGSMIYSEESIEKYGKRYKILNFPDILDKEELEQAALWEISPVNSKRIDVPKISIDVNAYEVDKTQILTLGDGVRIISKELKIDEIKRIIAIDYYPIQPYRSKYTIGDKAITLEEMLAKQEQTINTIRDIIDEKNEVKASGIQQLAPVLQAGKNFVFNSSFEVFSKEEIPQNWDCSNGAKISPNSQNWGSYSLMLPNGASAIQSEKAAIPIYYYETESNGTIIAFSHKWGSIKVSIIDADGNKIPHKSRFNPEKVEESIIPYDVYYREFTTITFLHEDIKSTDKKYRIQFECIDDTEAYVDNVMATPNKNNIVPLYRDGPLSISYEQIGSDTGSGQGGSSGAYNDNIAYYNLDDESFTVDGTQKTVLSLRLFKKDLDTQYFNINIQTNLILKNINSDIEMEVYFNDSLAYTVRKIYISPNDIFNYTKTITLPLSTIGEEAGSLVEVKVNGNFTVEEGSNITCIISKNTATKTTLLKIDEIGYDGSNLNGDAVAEIYQDEKGKIIMDIQCLKTTELAPISLAVPSEEGRVIFDTVEEINFYKSPESHFKDIPARAFQNHPNLKVVNGLNCFADKDTYITAMNHTFDGCQNLRKVTSLPKHVGSYQYTFRNCINLKQLGSINGTLGVSTGNVSMSYICQGCTSLEEVYLNIYNSIDGGHTNNMNYAFDGCTNLKTVHGIIRGTNNVGNLSSQAQYAFRNCSKLSGRLTMLRQFGTPNSSGTSFESRITGCFEGAATEGSLILDAPDSGTYLLNTKSNNSNITLA